MGFKIGDHVMIISAPGNPHIVGLSCQIDSELVEETDSWGRTCLVHELSLRVGCDDGDCWYSPPHCLMKIDPSEDVMNEEHDELNV